jgi:metal-responsive CopG/Arc/MetJ family transcriptional regulator
METTHVRLPADLVVEVDKFAAREIRSRANAVQLLVAEALKRRSQPVDTKQEDR